MIGREEKRERGREGARKWGGGGERERERERGAGGGGG